MPVRQNCLGTLCCKVLRFCTFEVCCPSRKNQNDISEQHIGAQLVYEDTNTYATYGKSSYGIDI
eukprot:5170567-Amphidinium_carterae.2